MNIGIPISKTAYTPESYAYYKYLTNKGHDVQLDYDLDPHNDINIYFMGLKPFWKKEKGRAKEIHEYQSLSTRPYANVKNKVKKYINRKPDGRIFLNSFIKNDLNFSDTKPFIYRDMGVDEALFQIPNPSPSYDVVYCGSISGRVGLIENLLNIAKFYKVIVVGRVSEDEKKILSVENITLAGIASREELPKIYRDARFGLNFTPDIYPYNVQTSTKTLEYLASGLGVISNKYEWAEYFFNKINYHPIWLDTNICNIIAEAPPPMESYSWEKVLDYSGFMEFLNECVE